MSSSRHPASCRGAYASSRYVECGLRWTRRRCARERSQGGESCERLIPRRTSDVVAYGKTVWSRRPWLAPSFVKAEVAQPGSAFAVNSQSDGGKRNSSPGRARHKPSSHCAGKAGCSPLDLYARVRTSLCILHTRPRVQRAPGLPCVLSSWRGQATRYNSGASRRENASSYPRSGPDTIFTDNHPELSPVATVSPDGIFPRLPRGRRQARKTAGEETPAENDLTIKGKAYIAGIYEHPTRHAPDKSTAQLACRGRQGRDRRCRADQSRYRRLFLRRRCPRRAVADGRLSRPQGAPHGFHRYRRLFLFDPSRPRRRSDRRRQMLDRADYAGGQAAHRPDAAARRRRRGRFRGRLRRDHPQRLRHVCHAPHARLRHHQRTAGLDQGRGLPSRPVQPARDAEGRRHRRGRR